jgi:hypothetical protein
VVEVRARESTALEIRLPDRPETRVVVAGRILDENDAPVAEALLSVRLDDGEPQRVFPEADGSFALHTEAPCEWVSIDTAGTVYGDPIEPATLRVPAETTDLLLRTRPIGANALVVFSLSDAFTGRPIADELDPAVIIYRQPPDGARIVAVSRFGPSDGVTEVDFRPHGDLRWIVLVPGYEEVRGRSPFPDEEAATPVVEVELRPGFQRELTIRDARSGAPVAGAEIRGPQGLFERSSSDGSATAVAGSWPELLHVTHPRYAAAEWHAGAYWSEFSGVIWLSPGPDAAGGKR